MPDSKVKAAIQNLHEIGKNNRQSITAPRVYVMEIIAGSTKPLTAYEILDTLGEKLKKPKPPTVYRALDFLVEHGLIHRIESINSYILCEENHKHSGSQFIICDSCGHAKEIHFCHLPKELESRISGEGFAMAYWNVEIHGRCSKCNQTDDL
ncbi:MAG: Fur family transcriptional regulator [Alphaproteobacteria bacterium]